MGGIVVGVDGSEQSSRALAWAVDEARVRGAHLTVVHAWLPPYVSGYPLAPLGFDVDLHAKSAQKVLDEAVDAVDTRGVTGVDRVLVAGSAAPELLRAAEGADLLVVGARGTGGFVGLLAGSVATQMTHHAPCPVVVVPAPA